MVDESRLRAKAELEGAKRLLAQRSSDLLQHEHVIVNQLQSQDEIGLVTFYAEKMAPLTTQIEQVADVSSEVAESERRCQERQQKAEDSLYEVQASGDLIGQSVAMMEFTVADQSKTE